jgi:hypothetical protein
VPRKGTSARREASRRYYEAHREEILAKRRARQESGQAGETKKALADHVRGEKVGNVAKLIGHYCGWDDLLDEIAKCEVVCSNCHRERTHQRKT